MQNDSVLQTRIHSLSDEELVEMIKKASEYRTEAIEYAQEELSSRGGLDAISDRISISQQHEVEKKREEHATTPLLRLRPKNTSSAGPQTRPWVRFWARQLDYSFGGLILTVLDTFLLEVNDTAFAFIVIFAWIFVESWLLSTWGTTPGKFLLRVSVHTPDGRCPSFSTALKRSFLVWWRGTGMGIPIINLITAKHAYDILTKQSRTTWDHDTKLVVTHKIIGANQIILTIAYALGILFLIILVST